MDSILAERVMAIVREAADIMLHADFTVRQKGGVEDLVTSSDVAVQMFLVEKITPLVPGAGFLLEEGGSHDSERGSVWINGTSGRASRRRCGARTGRSVAAESSGFRQGTPPVSTVHPSSARH